MVTVLCSKKRVGRHMSKLIMAQTYICHVLEDGGTDGLWVPLNGGREERGKVMGDDA